IRRTPRCLRQETKLRLRRVAQFETTGSEIVTNDSDAVDRLTLVPNLPGELDPLLLFFRRFPTLGTKVFGAPSCNPSMAALRCFKVVAPQPLNRRLAGLAFDEVEDTAELAGLVVGEEAPSVVDPQTATRAIARDAPAVGRARVISKPRRHLAHELAAVSHDATRSPSWHPH